jgi:hypothetical protein
MKKHIAFENKMHVIARDTVTTQSPRALAPSLRTTMQRRHFLKHIAGSEHDHEYEHHFVEHQHRRWRD